MRLIEALIGRVIDAVREVISRLLRRFTGLSPAVVQQLQRRQISDWQHRIRVLACPSLDAWQLFVGRKS